MGAEGLMERARSMRPSVNMSAANLRGKKVRRVKGGYKGGECTVGRYVHLRLCAQS